MVHEWTAALERAVAGHGFAALAVIDRGGDAVACSVPSSGSEPVFLAYSITKTFIASLVLLLVEDGALSLDDRIARWFPRIRRADRISVRQVLNHTSGIPDYGSLALYSESLRASPRTPWTFDRFIAETVEHGLMFEPGAEFSYSNIGYMLLKAMLERESGVSFQALVNERIARPFALGATSVAESLDDMSALASGISTQLTPDQSPVDVRAYYHPGWVSHGVVAATASDIARFLDALCHGRVVSRESLDQMLELVPVGVPNDDDPSPLRPREPGYGLGLTGDRRSPWGFLVGHNGGGPCYSASAFHSMERDATVCVMGAIETDFDPVSLVARIFDELGPPENL